VAQIQAPTGLSQFAKPELRLPETRRDWLARAPLIAGPVLAAICAITLPSVRANDGSDLSITDVNDKITLQNFGWAYTLMWAALVLTVVSVLAFPRTERFVQTIAVSGFAIVSCSFALVVHKQLSIVDGDRIGSGLILSTILLIFTAIAAWLRALWWDRLRPHPFGADWTKWLFMLPAVIWILGLTIFPLVYAFTTSRYFFRSGKISRFVGWDNYRRLFDLEGTGGDFLRAGIWAIVAVAVLMAIGLGGSWLSSREITRADVNQVSSFIPLVAVPTIIVVLVRKVLADPIGEQLYITMVFAAAAVSAEMILGFALALLMNREIRLRGIWRAVITLPIFATPVAIGYLFRTIFYEEGGPVNDVLSRLGLSQPWISSPQWAKVSTIIIDVWQWTPFVFIIALAGLQSLPQDVLEAAQVDGAKPWQVLRYITFPLMAPILWLIVLLRMIDAFKAFDVAIALTIGGPGRATEYYSLFNYRTARKFFNYGEASSQAFLLLVVVMILVSLLWSRIRHIYEDDGVRT
jgi:multiple sugar transport system permease protein